MNTAEKPQSRARSRAQSRAQSRSGDSAVEAAGGPRDTESRARHPSGLAGPTTEPDTKNRSALAHNIVALNDAGAVFCVLAARIKGTATDWPPGAIKKLGVGLRDRYGHALGPEPEAAVEKLLLLAAQP